MLFLGFPDIKNAIVVETDAPVVPLGAGIAQEQDRKIERIQFENRILTAGEKKYLACEREALAVLYDLRKFQIYLFRSQPFVILTDQQAL